jgi:hypothetical protein
MSILLPSSRQASGAGVDFPRRPAMRKTVIRVAMIVLSGTSAVAFDRTQGDSTCLEIHACTKNRFLRSVGLFGGTQPEIFVEGPQLRMEEPPARDARTRVLDVTGRLAPTAEAEIDKCGSWLEWSDGDGLVILTVLWDDRNCRSFAAGEDPRDCRSRARFGFSLPELGIENFPATRREQRALRERLAQEFVVDAYFAWQTSPRERRLETATWKEATASVHLVVRVIPLSSRDTAE